MTGAVKLNTAGGGSVVVQPASSIASDVTVNVPSQNCILGIQGPAFSARSGSSVACSTGVPTKLLSTTVDFDTASCYASSRFTPNVAGYYLITATAGSVSAWSAGAFNNTSIFKNGTSYLTSIYSPTTNFNNGNTSAIIYFNGTTDYVEVYANQNSGSTQNMALFAFTGCLVRAT